MNFFETLIDKVSIINPKYILPIFLSISVFMTSLLAPVMGEPDAHVFTKPDEKPYVGATMTITSDYKIIVSENSTPVENTAATVLKDTLKQISGIVLPVLDDSTDASEKEIIIGKTNREDTGAYTVDRAQLGDEGVYIKTLGSKIIISGGEVRGVLYAVYTFLEEYFDCYWFTYDFTVIPKKDTLTIPSEISYTYVPPISFRETDWISPARSQTYKVANKLNDNVYGRQSSSVGGGVSYAGGFCHTMASLIPASYFESEPTVFALGVRNGERTTDQPCLTNPRTLEIAKASVRRWLEQNPGAQIISVTQNDNQNYCVCDECKRIDELEGSHAGTMLRFVNAIADDIREDYPGVMVDTFAYQYTREPTKITNPRDNVIVRLCSIECKFSTPLNSGYCKENEAFAQDIEAWAKKCKNLFVWDYTTNYANYLMPFANFDVIAANMQFFVENNVIGVYEEGNYQAISSDGEFAELRCYLLSKLLWNPYCDIDKYMFEFCKAFYGDGYYHIIDFINGIDANCGFSFTARQWWFLIPEKIELKKGMGIYESPTNPVSLCIDDNTAAEYDKCWDFAIKEAKTDWQRENVMRSQICWRYWKACNNRLEFSYNDTDAHTANSEAFYNDLVSFGITRLREGGEGAMLTSTPNFNQPPMRWNA